MKIRKAEPEDAEYIKEAAERTWKETYIEILDTETIERIINDWYKEESLKRQIREHEHFYVIEEEGGLAGFINATVEDGLAELHRLYIYPEYWRQGFGTELYTRLEQKIGSEVEKIRLNVIPENDPAVDFYRKHGFETVEKKTTELKGEEVEQEVMEKKI
ncbi:MAG: ribosomal protein S18 acetylase RimI-like enzyme [Candidatus Nanohaloarchaea archaeon]|jgi:ribosomal protein S18 acetylase RimI-like enzyme